MRRNRLHLSIAAWASLAMPAVASGGAPGRGLTVLYNFTARGDGGYPQAALIYHRGLLYGTTLIGGASSAGTVFAVNARTGAETVLHSFTGGADGASPIAGLVFAGSALFGTSSAGGAWNNGAVFKVDVRTGRERVIYSFKLGAHGADPHSELILRGGALFGTTFGDGPAGRGTVFTVDPDSGRHAVLHNFKGHGDGANPVAGLLSQDKILYGTTLYGGAWDNGTAFMLDPATGAETVIHSFGAGSDGANPNAGLIDRGGRLFGTTVYGGATGNGTVFRFDLAAARETTLYSFKGYQTAANPLADGANPLSGLTDVGGRLFGTTSGGIACISLPECGTVFSVNPVTGREKVYVDFSGRADGGKPYAGLIYHDGAFYGTTSQGGASQWGTVFRFVP
jgi:uncharacterized repeat protein (TIGR03803 family)